MFAFTLFPCIALRLPGKPTRALGACRRLVQPLRQAWTATAGDAPATP